jgi:hypothetical protein
MNGEERFATFLREKGYPLYEMIRIGSAGALAVSGTEPGVGVLEATGACPPGNRLHGFRRARWLISKHVAREDAGSEGE